MRLYLAAIAAVLLASGSAYADTISAGAVANFTIVPSADSLSFNASTETVTVPGTFTQGGTATFNISSFANQLIPFTFVDAITVNGVTKDLTFSGENNVTPSLDTVTINALGPVEIDGDLLTFNSVSVQASSPGSLPVTLSASVTATPEPSSFALLSTGLLGAAVTLWRRFSV